MGESPIKLSIFDFVHDFAAKVQKGQVDRTEIVEEGSRIIIFCEGFFDQFFAALGYDISGFDSTAKEGAAELVERLRLKQEDTTHLRMMVSLFEDFCDMYADVVSGHYGGSITYQKFHSDYMTRLLQGAYEWAEAEGHEALSQRIARACTVYNDTIKATRWLTKTTKSESAWWRPNWFRRTNL